MLAEERFQLDAGGRQRLLVGFVADGEVIGEKHHAGGIGVGETDRAAVDESHGAPLNTQNPAKVKPDMPSAAGSLSFAVSFVCFVAEARTLNDQKRDSRRAGRDRRAAGVEGRESLQGARLPCGRAGAGDAGGGSGHGHRRRPAAGHQGHRRGAGEKDHRIARDGPAGVSTRN